MDMGRRLKQRLNELNMTQADFARLIGRSRQRVSQLIATPTWKAHTVELIAHLLRVSPNYFFKK